MKQNRSFLALAVAVFLQMVGVGMIVALLPSRMINLSGSMEYVGYIPSAFAVSFLVFQIPLGYLGDRYGYKIFLVGGYILSGLTGVVYFLSESVWGILGGRVLQGIGEVAAWALAPALISLLFRQAKGEALGKYNGAMHLGLTAGGLLSVYAYSLWSGNEAFLFYAAVGFVSALVVALFVENPKISLGEGTKKPLEYSQILPCLKKVRALAVLGGICLYGGSYGAFISVVPGVLLSEKGFSQTQVALFFALFYIAISVSQVLAGRFSDRRGREGTMYMGLLLEILGLTPFMWLTGGMIFLLLFVASFGLGMFCVAAMAFLNEAVPDSLKGSISGIFFVFWGVGFFFVPPIMTHVAGIVGYPVLFLGFSALLLLELLALKLRNRSVLRNY